MLYTKYPDFERSMAIKMRDYQIIISSFEYVALLELNIHKCVNEHAKAEVLLRIMENKAEEYLRSLLGEMWTKIEAVGEQGERKTLLSGIVTDFSIEHRDYEVLLRIEITSGTFLMDQKIHFRTFQNPDLRNKSIHELLVNKYDNSYLYVQEETEAPLGRIIIQYGETDWEFAKRMASLNNSFLIPAVVAKRVGYDVGLVCNCTRSVEKGAKKSYQLNNEIHKSDRRDADMGWNPLDEVVLQIMSREIYDLGDKIYYQNKEYYIYQIESNYTGGECVHTYYSKTKAGFRPRYHANSSIAGCSFEGKVIDVKEDKVKIDIRNDENKELPDRYWFSFSTIYSSPDGTGWYCMPEIGDSVRLYVPGEEKDAYVVSSVHKETDKGRKHPDYKSLKTKYGKEILFTPDTLIMTNNNGMLVELSDKEGINIVSDKDITIQAEGNMTIASQNASLLIAAQDKLQVKQGDTSMTLSEDISFTGGEFRIQ